jgi:hypothetical protein
METEYSLLYAQAISTGPYPEQDQSSSYQLTTYVKDQFEYYPSHPCLCVTSGLSSCSIRAVALPMLSGRMIRITYTVEE